MTDPTVLGMGDLMREISAGVLQRPRRTVLTMLGTVLGIGGLVATLGLTATASTQITRQFSVLGATQAIVTDAHDGASTRPRLDFPTDADRTIDALHGVTGSGVYWRVAGEHVVATRPDASADAEVTLPVLAASAGLTAAAAAPIVEGRVLGSFDETRALPVAVLGAAAAAQLGITGVQFAPTVFVDDRPFTVVGVVDSGTRLPEIGLSVMIPSSTAVAQFGPPDPSAPAHMLITTRLGAASQVAREAPIALRPDEPQWLTGTSAPDPHALQRDVTGTVNSLFLLLAALGLVAGMLGIANTTLVAVLERTSEIGLRRALGATRRQIATQFLLESMTVGTVGGIFGAALGVLCVVVVAVGRSWTATLDAWTVYPAPLLGALVGLVAGAYPATRAARTEPADALRQ